jgi:hypothetical protein
MGDGVGLGLQAIAFFGFVALALWLRDRREARKDASRNELYDKMLAAPGGSADMVRDLIRRDEDRRMQEDIDNKRLGGLTTTVAGLGFTVFLYNIVPDKPIYLVGTIPLLIGIVLVSHTLVLSKRRRIQQSA